MTAWQVAQFMACVSVATCVQSLTGFAFGLILLGLVGVLQLVPLEDAANVAGVLTLAQASVVLRGSRESIDLPTLRDTAFGSSIGVVVGVFLLGWFSANVVLLLRCLLGLTILACAAVLLVRSTPLRERSSRGAFGAFGLASGLMSSLFSSAGPPLVYQFYRQPMNPLAIRQTLVTIFAFNALLRLALVVPMGHFSMQAAWLSLFATPLVLALTWLTQKHPPRWSVRTVRMVVCALLALAGLSLVFPASANRAADVKESGQICEAVVTQREAPRTRRCPANRPPHVDTTVPAPAAPCVLRSALQPLPGPMRARDRAQGQ